MNNALPVLSKEPVKSEYISLMGQKARLGRKIVTLISYSREGRSGSYERGFKFSTTTYGGLKDSKGHLSFDHGKTWHVSYSNWVVGVWKATPRGDRIRIGSNSRGEFAFEGIQKINRDYDPNYKWKP